MALMLALIVLVVSIVWVSCSFGWGYGHFSDYAMGALLGLLLGAVLGLATFFGITLIANLALDHHDTYQGVDLVAVRDGTGTSGTFVWGSGNVGPTGTYSFYYRDGDAKILTSVESDGIKLYEDSDHAYAIYYTGCELSAPWVAPCFYNATPWREIHVPPGTVKVQTSLELNP